MRKVAKKQKTYKHKDWTIKIPRKGSKLDKELDKAIVDIKAGKSHYRRLDI